MKVLTKLTESLTNRDFLTCPSKIPNNDDNPAQLFKRERNVLRHTFM